VARVATRSSGREETPQERLDRNLNELLQELRVALPGVQVLFAFLLTVPFTQNFDRLTPFQEKLYFAVLLCTALSTALLIAPSIGHRVLFRLQEKEWLVVVSNRLAVAGLSVLAVAMCGVVLLISDLLFGTAMAVAATIASAVTFASLWYAGPLLRRRRSRAGGG
jgi:hypothetical protein